MYLIIGQGAAGTSAAKILRQLDPAAPVTMVTAEEDYFYNRIDLPDIIAGKYEPAASELQGIEGFRTLGITCRMGVSVQAIHAQQKIAQLASGEELKYGKLLFATGSAPLVPRLPGIEARGVYPLWTMAQARRIAWAARDASKAVVIGAGLIGLKMAVALASRGLKVTVIEKLPQIMPRQLDDAAATIVGDALRSAGIGLMLNTEAGRILSGSGVVAAVEAGGKRLACQIVILAVGVKPNAELAKRAGVAVNLGVVVDKYQQTSIANIYAAGDVAETLDPLTGKPTVPAIWPVAIRQGEVAGHNMAGRPMEYEGLLAMNAVEIAGIPLISIGDIEGAPGDEAVITQNANFYRKIVLRDKTIRGVLCLGDIRHTGVIGAQVIRQTKISDPSLLASPEFSFAQLLDS
jgi:NAD(P)H-nitrite reductase large subunit